MKFTLSAALTLLLSSLTTAQESQNPRQSKPFALVLQSRNRAYNNKALYACHQGAAIHGLCLGESYDPSTSQTFAFNTSADTYVPNRRLGKPGWIVYEWETDTLEGSMSPPPRPLPIKPIPTLTPPLLVSSSLSLQYNDASNVAVPLFQPGDQQATYMAFDRRGRLNIQAVLDDTVTPSAYSERTRGLYR